VRVRSKAVLFIAAITLAFTGALLWASGRDPFRRICFSVPIPGHGRMKCVAVLPKSATAPFPVILYSHGSGGTLLDSGNALRQMGEMGLAAVAMDYNQTNSSAFRAQFTALLDYVRRQPWADSNKIAWVGFSLGAQNQLSLFLTHPNPATNRNTIPPSPNLIIRLAGGWCPGLDRLRPADPSSLALKSSSVLIIHGEQDAIFPLADAQRAAACLRSNGVPVQLTVIPGTGHDLWPHRQAIFRMIAEHCLTSLNGPDAFPQYSSLNSWQARARPLWLWCLPAFLCAALMALARWYCPLFSRFSLRTPTPSTPIRPDAPQVHPLLGEREGVRASLSPTNLNGSETGRDDAAILSNEPPARWPRYYARLGLALRCLALVLALAALTLTALHLIPPRLPVSQRTLSIARKLLVQKTELSDFDALAYNPCWRGQRLRALLDHVHLANYNRQLIGWKVDDAAYRSFVLSPLISPATDSGLDWRRTLWESFYPRIRKEESIETAAAIVVSHLRERITIAPSAADTAFPLVVPDIWQRQITNAKGFENIYVAALRSVGIPARLSTTGKTEILSSSGWKPAPRPIGESRSMSNP